VLAGGPALTDMLMPSASSAISINITDLNLIAFFLLLYFFEDLVFVERPNWGGLNQSMPF
jgi:hypothetical protein